MQNRADNRCDKEMKTAEDADDAEILPSQARDFYERGILVLLATYG
jgi:hypothetical protein